MTWLTLWIPAMMLTRRTKNTIEAATVIFEAAPTPNRRMNIGARAGRGNRTASFAVCKLRTRIPALPRFSTLARFALLYAALYAAFGVASPFLPAFFGSRGLVAEEIGVALASGTAIRLVAGPLVARLADRNRAWSKLLTGCAAAAAGCALLFLPAHGFWMMLPIVLVQAAMLAPLAPLSDALALSASESVTTKPDDKGFQYGWVRGVGSAAFIAGSLLSGQAARPFGLAVAIWLNAVLLGVAALCALPLPGIAESSSRALPEAQRGGMLTLLKLPVFRRLMLTAALILGSHALHDGFAVISWTAAGIDTGTSSLIWSESVAAEVVVFLLIGPPLLKRLGPGLAAALAAAAGILRWSVMAVSTQVVALALVEPLHGFTFALLHLAAMRVIAETVPRPLAATAQALYGTLVVGAANALLTLGSGWLYANFGVAGFWAMAALCAAALPAAFGLGRS
jgi:PPP family 3-phenylpropionic acid transporter